MSQAPRALSAILRGLGLDSPLSPQGQGGRGGRVPVAGYILSVATVLLADAILWWLASLFGPMPPFITFYPAVLVVALMAGWAPGALAIACSVIVTEHLVHAPHTPVPESQTDNVTVGVFVAMSLFVCALAERLRRAHWARTDVSRQRQLVSDALVSVPEGIVALDQDGRIAFLNSAAEGLLGRKLADVRNLAWTSVLSVTRQGSREPVVDVVSLVLHSKAPASGPHEGILTREDGREIPVELTGAPARSVDGTTRGVVLTVRDCSARREEERQTQQRFAALDAERDWFSLVLASINEEVYFTDTQKRYTYANPAALAEFGHSTVEGMEVERIVSDLVVLRADGTLRPMAEAPPLRALTGEVVQDEEQIVRTPRTGELRNRLVSSAPVRNAHGEIIGSVSVVRDITELKRVEASLREADRRKNAFLATLSHELRNPLAPIRTAALLLESPRVGPDDLDRCRSIITRQVALMASLLNDLLDVSRFSRGELTLKKAYVPLRQVLDAALETAQPLIDGKRHRLLLELPSSPLVLEVDPVRMTQVISNLLTNAAKYTNPGGDITLGCLQESNTLVVYVRDNGIGLAPELFEQVFEMFVQLEPAKSRAEGGIGIGLALVRGLVELHGGRIDVHSSGPDQGSTFTVTLPHSIVSVDPACSSGQPAGAGAADVSSHRVLIADDNPDGAEALGMLLRLSGHEVHIAHNGSAALELAMRVKPDIALLDIGMPGLTGYELAARLRAEAWGARMKLIAITGWGNDEDRRRALACGFDHHFTKPMDPARLEVIFASMTAAPAEHAQERLKVGS